MTESNPNATSASDPAAMPALTATMASMTFQAMVSPASHRPRRTSRSRSLVTVTSFTGW